MLLIYKKGKLIAPLGVNGTNFILEILSGNQRIEKLLSTLDHSMNFTTSASQMGVIVEGFPKVIDGLVPGFSTSIDKDTNLRVEHLPNSIEEPTVGVDLLLILGLEDENNLHGDEIVRVFTMGENQLWGGINGDLSGIL